MIYTPTQHVMLCYAYACPADCRGQMATARGEICSLKEGRAIRSAGDSSVSTFHGGCTSQRMKLWIWLHVSSCVLQDAFFFSDWRQ
ncbi:hypothetical protein BRADI_5g20759v3 [Brachypodium distachyon]|uniref:Uncharacterized protein n=1 Tax=Brachypodium distachyon TaxID=15368 RepID=A0A2K2CIC9_BRADI|nr:hypothetical protein BRADI_5g20759v3 [Brachypodium distachyon]